jgi:membrane protein DedA with SNARE-associated domain
LNDGPEPEPLPAPDPVADEPSAARRHNGPPSKRIRNITVGALIALTVAAWTGDLLLAWHDEHPLLFISLNARNRNLLLASPYLDSWTFYSVGLIRLLASDPLFFLFGRWYGDAAVRWMERKAPTYGQMLRSAEGWFGKAAYPMVALAPNNFICLFAGSYGMSPLAFVLLNVFGTIGRLWALRAFGKAFSSPVSEVSGFVQDHRLPIFVASLVLLSLSIWSERRAGGTDIEALDQIEREAEADAPSGPDDGGTPAPDPTLPGSASRPGAGTADQPGAPGIAPDTPHD